MIKKPGILSASPIKRLKGKNAGLNGGIMAAQHSGAAGLGGKQYKLSTVSYHDRRLPVRVSGDIDKLNAFVPEEVDRPTVRAEGRTAGENVNNQWQRRLSEPNDLSITDTVCN